jgi:pentatricopeptide repeat protein
MMCTSAYVQEALATFEEMKQNGVEPDTQSYTALMDAYGRAGLCKEAEHLMVQMQDSGFIPDVVTYGVLLRAFATADRFHEGLKYYDYILQHSERDNILCHRLISQHKEQYEYLTKYTKK